MTMSSYAQEKLRTWSVGLYGGHGIVLPSSFIFENADNASDLRGGNGDFSDFDILYGLYVEKQFNPTLGLRVGYTMGTLTGENEGGFGTGGSTTGGEFFTNSIGNLYAHGTYNFSNLSLRKGDTKLGFYAIFGGGLLRMNYERGFVSDGRAVVSDVEESALKADLGIGLKYQISNAFRVELQTISSSVFRADLDGDYIDSYGDSRDYMQTTTLGLAYSFGKGKNMGAVSKYSDDYFFANEGIKERMRPDSSFVEGIVDAKVAASMKDIKMNAKKIAELEAELKANRAELDKLKTMKKEEVVNATPTYMNNVYSVFFDTSKSKLKEQDEKQLTDLAILMNANPNLKVLVTGYTDRRGGESLNYKLRLQRANAVKDFLMKNANISSDRIAVAESTQNIIGKDVFHLNRKATVVFQ